jgi:hypothetical protein
VTHDAPAARRIAKNCIASSVLAKYTDTAGGEGVSHYSAATIDVVFPENALTTRLFTLAHDSRAGLRITINSNAGSVLAKYANTGGGEAVSHYSAATVRVVFSENALTTRLLTLAHDSRAEPRITINSNA